MDDFEKLALDIRKHAQNMTEAALVAYWLHAAGSGMAEFRLEYAKERFRELADVLGYDLVERHNPAVETIAPDMPLVSMPQPDRASHRAAVGAGYASLDDYVKLYGGEK